MHTMPENNGYVEVGEASSWNGMELAPSTIDPQRPESPMDPWSTLINPLVDAPPRPPPMASYQHAFSIEHNESSSFSEDVDNTDNANHGSLRSNHQNYFYASSQRGTNGLPYSSPGIHYELELRKRRRKNRCRLMMGLAFLGLVAWYRQGNSDAVPSQERTATVTTTTMTLPISTVSHLRAASSSKSSRSGNSRRDSMATSLSKGDEILDALEESLATTTTYLSNATFPDTDD